MLKVHQGRRVLLTGATGFVGRMLADTLAQSGATVRAALRSERVVPACIAEKVIVGNIGATTDWAAALQGVDTVVHVAARAHVRAGSEADARLHFEINARGTSCLVTASSAAKVRRFIYLSSIKVNGEEMTARAYTAVDEPHPQDAYGKSKWLAEQSIMEAAATEGLKAAIVRPPLVYGPGVRANFLQLLRWVDRQWPLPLAAIQNRRSFVSIWNLCDMLVRLLDHPAAPGKVWMVSDGCDLSTPELIRRMGQAMKRRVTLLPVAPATLQLAGALLGRKAQVARLCGSLVVDISETRRELDWSPPISVDEALARTCAWYVSQGRRIG